MRKAILFLSIFSVMSGITWAQDEFDDIYYNPNSGSTTAKSTKQKKNKSAYIKDFGSVDVDEYNRRGQYYMSPVDTIGSSAEQGDDFIYTQQIQKYYNPTIVVDNAGTLQDILNNSYGNVEIVYNDYGNPVFMPSYGYPYNRWNYWYNSWDPYWSWNWGSSWNWNWAWGPSWSWNWGPSWAWNWGPSWGWGPSWSWGPSWGPVWGWGPSWGPSWGHGGHWADYHPNGNRPNRPGQGWASNTQPGYNRPYSGVNNSTSHTGFQGGTSGNHHRTYGGYGMSASQNRVNSSQGSSSGSGNGYTINSNGHRTYNSSTNVNTNTHRSNNNVNSYTNTNRNNNYNSRSTTNSNRSYNSGSGRSYNSGGSSRSTGGGGSRGRHR